MQTQTLALNYGNVTLPISQTDHYSNSGKPIVNIKALSGVYNSTVKGISQKRTQT